MRVPSVSFALKRQSFFEQCPRTRSRNDFSCHSSIYQLALSETERAPRSTRELDIDEYFITNTFRSILPAFALLIKARRLIGLWIRMD
jgi:hypothetical protein